MVYTSAMVDYERLYREVNQTARAVGINKVRCGEMMAIHRMFVKLDSLTVENLDQYEVVKGLVVIADVVEIEGSSELTLPGSEYVLIFCRILHVKTDKEVVLNLNWKLSHNPPPSPSPRCSFYAQEIVASPNATLLIQVKHNDKWSNDSTFTQCIGRRFSYSSTNSSISSTPPSNVSSLGNPPTSNLILVEFERMNILYNDTNWRAFIRFQVSIPSSYDLLFPNVVEGFESTLLIVEMILSYQTDNRDLVHAAQQHLHWVDKLLLEVVSFGGDAHVQTQNKALLSRAQMLLKMPLDGSQSLVVPQLEYTGYEQVIRDMANMADAYNREFQALNQFIISNQITGQYMLNQNKALAERENDIQALESLIVLRKEQELDQAMRRLELLENNVRRQANEMDAAKDRLDQAIQDASHKRFATAYFALLGATFQIVGSLNVSNVPGIVVGIGGGINDLVNAANEVNDLTQRNMLRDVANKLGNVERVVEVVNAVQDLYKNATSLEDILNAPEMPIILASEWDSMENDVVELAAFMPTEVSIEVSTWTAKCKNVMSTSREICTTAVSISQIQCDLFVHAKQLEIAQRHAERLEEMQAVDLGDFLEMAMQMDMRTTRFLINLFRKLAIQNGALQYHYLLPPRPFTSWPTIDNVRRELVLRAEMSVLAQEQLGPPIRLTRTYAVHSIPVGLLLSGDDWNFHIDPSDDSTFPSNWSQVRIRYLEMEVTGEHKPITQSGEVYLLLQASSMFQDRLRGQIFHYEAAAPLSYAYAYNLATGETTLPNQPHEEGRFLRMTPFTRWRLRLSATAPENQGLSFPTATDLASSTQISITFYVTAIVGIHNLSSTVLSLLDYNEHGEEDHEEAKV